MNDGIVAHHHSPWWRVLEGGLLLVLVVAVPAIALRSALRPADPLSGVAVVYAPWTEASAAAVKATAAGAALVRFGAVGFVVVVKPDDPTYVDRVLSDGALFAVDPNVLALCAPGLSARDGRAP